MVFAAVPVGTAVAANEAPVIAIVPGSNLPVEGLAWFEQAAVDPVKATDAELAALKRNGVKTIALMDPNASPTAGPNNNGGIPLLEKVAARGFGGFLFDARRPASANNVELLLREARRRFPQSLIYFRGPTDRLPALAPALSGFVTDGVFAEPEGTGGELSPPVAVDDLEAVRRLAALVQVRRKYHFPFIVADRLPVGHREQARGVARTLVENGFIPYVTVGRRLLGIGQREAVPRKILALYDSEEDPYLPTTIIHRYISVPLEYFGYSIDYADVRNTLPAGDLASKYAGIVTWFGDDDMSQPRTYEIWLETQLAAGLRIAILGRMGFDPSSTLLARMGISESFKKVQGPVTITMTGKAIGYEARPTPLLRGLRNWRTRDGDVHLELRDATGQTITPVVTGAWGGVALEPYVVDLGIGGRLRWIVDPFAFFTRALDLEPMPSPDITTENGRRLLFIHIDGDGFASPVEMPGAKIYSGQLIKRDFLEKYPLPTTVSVIEGETSKAGAYPQLADKLEPIAREIFRLPNVEPASHSYTHPLDWVRAAKGEAPAAAKTAHPVMSLTSSDPNYHYTPAREVTGSIQYINEKLAPKDKPARVFLWSGEALPEPDAMKEIATSNLFNMNGGTAEMPLDDPSLSMVMSLGRWVGGVFQVYSQAQNENVYTNFFRGPYYGFRRVIDMFKYTESPRRLKPINIYYHFYSGTKLASITALHEIYEYAMSQDTMPIVVSEMVAKANDFNNVTLARRLDGTWELRGFNNLRTVRLDKRLGWPNIVDSENVIGVEDAPQGRYVALSGADHAVLALQTNRPTVPHLATANAPVVSWQRDRETVKLHLKGHMPVDLTVGGCTSPSGVSGARVRSDSGKRTARLTFSGKDTREVTLSCR